jgi:shikimate kinase
MLPNTNIVLTGPMGCGKSTVGRLVAERLSREFCDTDKRIEEITGLSITRIFSERSEAYFRLLEKDVVQSIAQTTGLVVAAGGGMTIPEENFRVLSEHSLLIRLDASIPTLACRLRESACRPLLLSDDLESRIARILNERRPMYERIGLAIPTDGLTIDEVAARVIEVYREQVECA